MSEPRTCVKLVPGPLEPGSPAGPDAATGASGALVVFEGVVRGLENGRSLAALRYEAYEPMTTSELRGLAVSVAAEHGLHAIDVEHSIGEVAVGERSFRLRAAGAHRAETLAATGAFIERMKVSVPLWKVPVFR